jgi:hypothetical protein
MSLSARTLTPEDSDNSSSVNPASWRAMRSAARKGTIAEHPAIIAGRVRWYGSRRIRVAGEPR